MDIEYVRQRITELRLKRNISEYQLSYDVGHSKNYVHNIVSGYSQPSVKELLYLIEALVLLHETSLMKQMNLAILILLKGL